MKFRLTVIAFLLLSCESSMKLNSQGGDNGNPGLNFSGIDSVSQVSATSSKISWTSHPDAKNYFIFNAALQPQVLLATVPAPASDYTIVNLEPQTNYKFIVRAQNSEGIIDTNSNFSQTTTLARGNYSSLIQSDSPIGYWRLGDASAVAEDATSSGNDGTINGSIGYGASGALIDDTDNGLSFDGSTTSVSGIGTVSTFAFIHTTAVFTVEIWAKLTDHTQTTDHPIMANEGTGTGKGFHFSISNSDGKKRFYFAIYRAAGGGAGNIFTAYSPINTVVDNNWHHYAAVGNGSDIKLYFDGEHVSTRTIDYAFPVGNAGNKLGIGGYQSGGNPAIWPGIKGDLDEAAIYDKALSSEKIKARFQESGR